MAIAGEMDAPHPAVAYLRRDVPAAVDEQIPSSQESAGKVLPIPRGRKGLARAESAGGTGVG
jgi:hypothetical protein